MLSIIHFILFSTLFCLSSAIPGFQYFVTNDQTAQKLKGDFPWLRISAVPSRNSKDDATLFNVKSIKDGTYSIESVKFKGQFINCLGQGIPCHLFNIPTLFGILHYNETDKALVDSHGLRLTIGKTKENYVSLEQADDTLNQRFRIAFRIQEAK